MSEKKLRAAGHLALAAILVIHLATNLSFIAADSRPANINELSHVMPAIDFANLLHNQPDPRAAYLIAFSGYPPVGVVASLAYGLMGRVHDSAQISQLLFSLVAILSLYALGAGLFGRGTGLLAAAFFVSSPAVCEVSRQYLLEWPLCALSTLAVFFLWRARGYSDKTYAYLAGAAIGASALCKQTFLIFLAGPLLVSAWTWLRAIREGPGGEPNIPRRWGRMVPALAVGPILALLLYPENTRNAIDVWFSISAGSRGHWGLVFALITALLASGVTGLILLGAGPVANALGAGGLAILVASLWYFPKGIGNWLTYAGQMKMNVATMSPLSLMNFYLAHLKSYYLGVIPYLVMIPVATLALCVLAARRPLSRHFYRAEQGPLSEGPMLCAAWLVVPVLSFFFINIQNEMNTVPIMPPLSLLAAFLVTRLFPPYSRRRRAGGALPLSARLIRGFLGSIGVLAILAIVVAGLATAMIFPDGKGGYRELPYPAADRTASLFPRKGNTLNYLVPMSRDWHVETIVDRIIKEIPGGSPRVLSMDVNFYFSWNTFWYEFKLRNREVIIETQWDDDRDILSNPEKEGRILSFDAIVYREPWRQVYESSRNDYIDYKNLWKTYEYLEDPPEEFRRRYAEKGRYELPDGTYAVLLLKVSEPVAGSVILPPQSLPTTATP